MRARGATEDVPEARKRRAARLLLARPLLVAGQTADDEFRLVRAYAAELREWFDRETGWRLLADAQTVRLMKVTADPSDGTHPARDPRSRTPFSRQRYVLTCLALAALDRADGQVTLGRLAEEVVTAAADPALVATGFTFGLDRRERRADMVAVVRLLLHWGVVRRVAGDEEAYLGAGGDVLYDVDRPVIAGLLATTRGPSMLDGATPDDRLAALTLEVVPDVDDARNRALRHRLTRLLLEQPVVYYDELTEPERAYLTSQRHALLTRITSFTGLVAEVRREGIAMVDPDDELTDVRMPAEGMQSHLTLLLAERIAASDHRLRVSDLQRHTRELAREHRSYWRKHATDPGAEVELVATALDALRALKLVTVEPADDPLVLPRPAIARYALAQPTIREPASGTAPTARPRPDISHREGETAP
ncbi:TIGR02678 family protein [Micromonospora sp. DR5-3]|uniref:TIGR02678 family protein n=1 Tax=unclassified Micromonospora TaxID=2617518 RepID=UPI0011DA7B45|nr:MULTISPECIES: TIGR02678 family protein [unclassified Micromonospora]MCW3817984.1 TIGR02678 family protein [Micromonospora sp. DR5-3]TYC19060.1 TIGR02678 family protein [Micromonospora sp. MP36]